MNGSPDYNNVDVTQFRKKKGNTVFGNKDADILDVFIFWREEIQGCHPYSKRYMKSLTEEKILESYAEPS